MGDLIHTSRVRIVKDGGPARRAKVRVPHGKRADALRAIEVHEKGCPASQSVQRGIAIEWDGEVEEE